MVIGHPQFKRPLGAELHWNGYVYKRCIQFHKKNPRDKTIRNACLTYWLLVPHEQTRTRTNEHERTSHEADLYLSAWEPMEYLLFHTLTKYEFY